MAILTTKVTSIEHVVGGLAARVAALEAGAISASSVSGSPTGSCPLPGQLGGSTATGSRDARLTKTGIQEANSTLTLVQMMKMHEAPYFYGFLVNNATQACLHTA